MVASAEVENSQTHPTASIYLLIDIHDLVAARRHYDIRSRRIVTGVGRIPCVDLVGAGRRDVSHIPCRVTYSLRRCEAIVRATTLTAEAGKVPVVACRKAS